MIFLVGVLIFVVALLGSVMLHEAGHFLTAKAFGMKATQFFVGFGRTIWSKQRGETEYGIKSLPVGGFVKITGMTTMDDIDPAEEPRSFRSKPGWQRAIVLVAGSFMHFVIAFVLLWVLAVGVGLTNSSTTTIGVLSCVPAKEQASCTRSDARSPAEIAGLRAGDKIVEIAGRPVSNWTQVGAAIKAQPTGRPVSFTIERGGRRFTKQITLAPVSWRKGAYLGVQPVQLFARRGPIDAIGYAGSQVGTIVSQSVTTLGKLPQAIPYLFAKNRGSTPGGQVSSVVGAAHITGSVVAANFGWQEKITIVLTIIIDVNIFVGIFNLLPLLPLDGGHLAVVVFERLRAGWARLRHRPDPGLVDIQRLVPVSVGVFAILVALGLLLIAADVFNPVNLVQ
jgi:membrane-associated protease RseP (regulator of RpoE activity)